MNKDYSRLEEKLGYCFKNKRLIEEALTHSSYINEAKKKDIRDNERLEFFGDAIIEFYVSDYLFKKFPDLPEGALTKTRASMVCESGLATCARELDLGDYIFMGKGEELSGGRNRASITSDAFEALTAAIYLDAGREVTEKFINEYLLKTLEDKSLFFDAKTRLQEIAQKSSDNELKYELLDEAGPVHERIFTYAAFLNGREIGRGRGRSKKEAQQQAAFAAIKTLG